MIFEMNSVKKMAIRLHHPHGTYQQEEKKCDVIGRQHETVCFGSLLNESRATAQNQIVE